MNILQRFNQYQNERFPLKILIFTTLSSTLVSVAVTGNTANIWDILAVFFSTLFFVFHIRVIDESRDAAYDRENYPDRPIQQGLISVKELFGFDVFGLIISLLISFVYGLPALFWFGILVVFTSLAWKDFFASRFFENKPMLYHIVNSPQMIFLQLFIYAILTKSFEISWIMCLQIVLVYINIFILELIRKIKSDSKSKEIGDLYSTSMGFSKALYFNMFLSVTAFVLFVVLLMNISENFMIFLIAGSVLFLFSIISSISYVKQKSKTNGKLVLLSGILIYVGLNTLLYLSVI